MCIHKYKVLARFGLMHMVGTNLCVWLKTIVMETMHEIEHHLHLHHEKAEGHHGTAEATHVSGGHGASVPGDAHASAGVAHVGHGNHTAHHAVHHAVHNVTTGKIYNRNKMIEGLDARVDACVGRSQGVGAPGCSCLSGCPVSIAHTTL